jgi:hypothetical protein
MRKPAITLSRFMYSMLVRCYPPALREQFGQDMTEVFSERLDDGWSCESWRGVWRAWFAVGTDLVEIVLPYQATRIWPVLIAFLCSAVFYGYLLMAISPNRHCVK